MYTPRYRIGMRVYESGFPRMILLRLSEKGTSNGPSEDLVPIRSTKWPEEPLLGSPSGCAGSASETFRTVSLGNPLSGDSATLCLRMCHLEHNRHERTRRLTPHGSATQNRGAT